MPPDLRTRSGAPKGAVASGPGSSNTLDDTASHRQADDLRRQADDALAREDPDHDEVRRLRFEAAVLDRLAELHHLGNLTVTLDEVRQSVRAERVDARHARPHIGAVRAAVRSHDGAVVLDELVEFVRRFVAFPSEHAAHATALWAAHAHALDAFESTPRLALLSPEPASGKTRTLEVLELLVPNPMHALSASPAPIFRSIEEDRPTLLFDEVDALFGRRGSDDGAEDLRGLLNAGHRTGATIPRCVGPRHDVRRFPVYAAAALAGLGDLPDTLMSRSLVVRMRRRAPGEHVESFRHRIAAPEGHKLRDRLASWVTSVESRLRGAWPTMPPGVADQSADCWEPLLAIADAAGGHWPQTARAACVELVRVTESREASLGVRLLADLRAIFADDDRLATETILDRLHKLDEAPWSDLRGRPLDARGLARRLSGYGVSSTKVKIVGESLRGYRREDLYDAWTRYVPAPTLGEAEPPEPAERPTSAAPAQVPLARQVPEPVLAMEPPAPPLTCTVPEVPQVPDFGGAERDDEAEPVEWDEERHPAPTLAAPPWDPNAEPDPHSDDLDTDDLAAVVERLTIELDATELQP